MTLIKRVFAIALFALISSQQMAFAAPKEAGKVVKIKGEIRIDDANGNIVGSTKESANRRVIKEGSVFFVGEIIKTFGDSRVKLEFNQGGPGGNNSVVLGANTRLAIEDISQNGEKKATSLQLYEGEVRSDVKARYQGTDGDKYQVKTQNAVAGVRGTIFTAMINSTGHTVFATEQGKVMVSALKDGISKGVTAEVKAGNYTEVVKDAPPKPVAPISSNPALSAKVQNLNPDNKNSDERLPAEQGSDKSAGDKKDPNAKSADSGDKPAAAGDNKGDGKSSGNTDAKASGGDTASNDSSGDNKPAAPLFREKENKSANSGDAPRGPASVGMGTPVDAKAGPVQMMAPNKADSPAMGAGISGTSAIDSSKAQMNQVLGQIQGTISQTNTANQNNTASQQSRGTACVALGKACK